MRNVATNERSLFSRTQYWSLLIYIILMYLFNGDQELYFLMYAPVAVFVAIELGYTIKSRKIQLPKPILAMFLFSAVCLMTCLWAQRKDVAMTKTTTVFLLTSVLAFMYNYCLRTKKSIDDILKMLLVAGLFFTVYIICYYGIDTLSEMFVSRYVRVGDDINNANVVGMELALTAIIAVYFGMNKNKKYYLLSVVPIILALGTASKKAIIFILLGTILLILLKRRNRHTLTDSIKKIILPTLVLVATLFVVQLGLFPTLTDRMNGFSNSLTGEGRIDGSTITRNKFIDYGLMSFLEHPIGGIGVGNSGIIALEAAGRDTYLHNNYIELLASVGILGTIIYYYVFVILLLSAIKNRKDERAPIIIVILVLCLALDWGAVSYCSKNTYFYILLGLLFSHDVSKKNSEQKYIERREE